MSGKKIIREKQRNTLQIHLFLSIIQHTLAKGSSLFILESHCIPPRACWICVETLRRTNEEKASSNSFHLSVNPLLEIRVPEETQALAIINTPCADAVFVIEYFICFHN